MKLFYYEVYMKPKLIFAMLFPMRCYTQICYICLYI